MNINFVNTAVDNDFHIFNNTNNKIYFKNLSRNQGNG